MSKKALNDEQIVEMREMYATHSQQAIADHFRVSRRTIQRELDRIGALNPTVTVTPAEHKILQFTRKYKVTPFRFEKAFFKKRVTA